MENNQQPVYGNWISNKRIRSTFIMCVLFAVLTVAAFILAATCGILIIILGVVSALIAALMLVAGVYFISAKEKFSYTGGNIQNKITNLVIDHIKWDGNGRAIDIGCGSGALSVKLAKKYADAQITGVDYWGGSWEYQKEQCERNALLEGVEGRIEFVQGSASKLPFKDGEFHLAVSNLVFHEVKDVSDKRDCIKEALRVVKKGGVFVFQDLFQLKAYYGTPDDLILRIKSWGVEDVHFKDTSTSPFIPRSLKLPFMTGALGMIWGVK